MNKFIQRLFFFEKFQIKTRMSKKEILKKIDSFADPQYTDYYGFVSEEGFFIAEKNRKHFFGGHSENPFAPVAKAKITEGDGMTTVSTVISMHFLIIILFAPLYIISLLTLVMFPFWFILFHFCFAKPAKRLKEELEYILMAEDVC